jgi:hypothetical protein
MSELTAGVTRTDDHGGLPPSMLEAIADVGGLWAAGDYYASAGTIVESARAHGVRALQLDARDLTLLDQLPQLEFLHLRSDGRADITPVRALGHLRGLVIDHDAGLRGTIDLSAHPHLLWLKLKLSGKGGAANVPKVLAGHPGILDLRIGEAPMTDLTDLARAFPNLRCLRIFGANRMRAVGEIGPWAASLERLSTVWAPLRTLDELERLHRLSFLGVTFGRMRDLEPLVGMTGMRYLSLLGTVPSLRPLVGHPGIRMARLSMPADEDLGPLATWPALVALIGQRWIAPGPGVPFLETHTQDHPLVAEWRAAAQTSEPLLTL